MPAYLQLSEKLQCGVTIHALIEQKRIHPQAHRQQGFLRPSLPSRPDHTLHLHPDPVGPQAVAQTSAALTFAALRASSHSTTSFLRKPAFRELSDDSRFATRALTLSLVRIFYCASLSLLSALSPGSAFMNISCQIQDVPAAKVSDKKASCSEGAERKGLSAETL